MSDPLNLKWSFLIVENIEQISNAVEEHKLSVWKNSD